MSEGYTPHEVQVQADFEALLTEFSVPALKAGRRIQEINNAIIEATNPHNKFGETMVSGAELGKILPTKIPLQVGDIERLERGMDADGYGAGIENEEESQEAADAAFYREVVIRPIVNRFDVKEETVRALFTVPELRPLSDFDSQLGPDEIPEQ